MGPAGVEAEPESEPSAPSEPEPEPLTSPDALPEPPEPPEPEPEPDADPPPADPAPACEEPPDDAEPDAEPDPDAAEAPAICWARANDESTEEAADAPVSDATPSMPELEPMPKADAASGAAASTLEASIVTGPTARVEPTGPA